MDNVTHSLAGLLLGETAVQLRRARGRGSDAQRDPTPGFRTTVAVAAVVGANLPDIDVLYAAAALDKLGSLLHHRGHTHTLVAAVPGIALVWGGALALWHRFRRRDAPAPDAEDRRWLLLAVTAAVLSHVTLDWTNNYGVHPFWPVGNRWHYGDAVFIIEPWLWVAAVPPLLFAARRRAWRVALGLVLAAGLALAWAVALVPFGAALALTAGAALSVAVARRLAPGARAAAGVGGWLGVELAFFAGTGAARRQLEAAARASDPAAQLADLVVTPGPANPLCATAFVVEAAGPERSRYRVTTAWAAAAPTLVSAARCATGERARTVGSLPMAPSPRPSTTAVRWDRTWEAPVAELVALGRDNCQVAALLRFARVPFWLPVGPDTLHVGDLRYDREPGPGFAEFLMPVRPARCPSGVPPWRPPRADLLAPG